MLWHIIFFPCVGTICTDRRDPVDVCHAAGSARCAGVGQWWERTHHDAEAPLDHATPAALQGHLIIIGFGRIGQLLAKLLAALGVRYISIENDLQLSTRCHPLGEPVYYGDVSRPELLHRVHASAASAIVLTMDHAEAAVHVASAIRREFSEVPLFARARDEYHARAKRSRRQSGGARIA